MIKIEAITLEEAYSDASSKLSCSITEMEVEVIQHPKKGFMGLFSKKAIIVARVCDIKLPQEQVEEKPKHHEESLKEPAVEEKEEIVEEEVEEEIPETHQHSIEDNTVVESFFEHDATIEDSIVTIKKEINALFDTMCFEIDPLHVEAYDESTVLIEITGKDAALLIGKEGYRYKALSYMIYSWITTKYRYQVRLEIAEFLKNQEESISQYVNSLSDSIDKGGRTQTKVLDGILVQIALKQLRDQYPHKYVAVRNNKDGSKFIIINDYN